MAPIKDAGKLVYGLFKPECFDLYFNKHEFLDPTCMKLVISKLLGYGIVLGSSVVKVPQILKLVKSKSSASLSISAFCMELVGYTIAASYNFRQGYPFSTYGESVFLMIQGLILVYLIWKCNQSTNQSSLTFIGGLIGYFVFAYACFSSLSMHHVAQLQTFSIPLFAASKFPQLYSNLINQSTGQLSLITTLMNTLGTVARIFTTYQEVNDVLILGGTILGSVLNCALLGQMIYYWKSTNQAINQSTKKANNQPTTQSTKKTDNETEGLKQRKRASNKE